ncbi:MAG TPA: hypothetical protein VEW69_10235 [Alphaproteobacteria bacterium]|nr:hypothetical protein [Alphaproteobacteria bacterium]
MTKKSYYLAAAAVLLFAMAVLSQTTNQVPDLDKNGRPVVPRPTPHVGFSPNDLGHNAVALPASGQTPNTAIVRVSSATKLTLMVNCTQAVGVSVNVYTADDQTGSSPNYTLYGTYTLVSNTTNNLPVNALGGGQQIYIATELGPNTSATAPAGAIVTNFRLPQYAISFFETNSGATAGTCTDRLIVGY